MAKKNTKIVKPTYIVDITKCNDVKDMKLEFIISKVAANVPINLDELLFYTQTCVDHALHTFASLMVMCECTFCEDKPKKLPWYKRFWNKLKYAFTW